MTTMGISVPVRGARRKYNAAAEDDEPALSPPKTCDECIPATSTPGAAQHKNVPSDDYYVQSKSPVVPWLLFQRYRTGSDHCAPLDYCANQREIPTLRQGAQPGPACLL
ncbi:hypothetical protein QAD02_010468 [Eretmocerus hayati]|uniref:Uncharacterized protein n=1 Tax=Eretmocerus hayati TaxID=131215 RepID=A0ACC2NWU4_9HYME|nr:hypothetical protein QAD02_010468 [Eretmocerus hayati]